MAKKRLTFEVEEDLHSRLKQEAAKHGVPLGALCSSLLDESLDASSSKLKSFDPRVCSSLPLDLLREEIRSLTNTRPPNWEVSVRRINSEIQRRFKI